MCRYCNHCITKDIYININMDAWYSLFNIDTKYHRPRSNDIFYKRHKRKNK